MVTTRSSSSRAVRFTRAKTEKTAPTVKQTKGILKTTKKATTTKNARTSIEPDEYDCVRQYYMKLCEEEVYETYKRGIVSPAFLSAKFHEFPTLSKEKQLEITKKYRAEKEKNKDTGYDFLKINCRARVERNSDIAEAHEHYVMCCIKDYRDQHGKEPTMKLVKDAEVRFSRMSYEDKMKIYKEFEAERNRKYEERRRNWFGLKALN